MDVTWKQYSLAPWITYAKTRLEVEQQAQGLLESRFQHKRRELRVNSSGVTRECSPIRPVTRCGNRPNQSALRKSVNDLKSSVRELKESFKYSSLCSTRRSSTSHSSPSPTQPSRLILSALPKRSATFPSYSAGSETDSFQLPCASGDFPTLEEPARKTFAKVNTLIPAKMSEFVETINRGKDAGVWYLRVEVTKVKCQTLEPPYAELAIGRTVKAPANHHGFRIYPSLSQASVSECALMRVRPESLRLSETGVEAAAVHCLALVHAPQQGGKSRWELK